MTKYVTYAVDDYNENATPIAVGTTREEAQSIGIQRVLSLGVANGSIVTQQRDDIADDDFTKLGEYLNTYFA